MGMFDGNAAVALQRVQELVACFPCAVLDGVRWSVLCKAYTHRYPQDRFGPPPVLEEAQIALAGVLQVGVSYDGTQEPVVLLQDAAVGSHCNKDQLACWPLLVKALVHIVQTQGSTDVAANSISSQKDEHAASVVQSLDGQELEDREIVGVLQSRLKFFLRQHWDATFDERAISFYSESGNFVTLKKMKHFLAEVIKWVDQGRQCAAFSTPRSLLGDCLGSPLELRISQKNNDMILCCQKPLHAPITMAPGVWTQPMAQDVMLPTAHTPFSNVLEEAQYLWMENMNLKKQLEIQAEEIRSLKLENFELKSSSTFSSGTVMSIPCLAQRPNMTERLTESWKEPAIVRTPTPSMSQLNKQIGSSTSPFASFMMQQNTCRSEFHFDMDVAHSALQYGHYDGDGEDNASGRREPPGL